MNLNSAKNQKREAKNVLPLSIAIISYNEEKNIRRCLESITDIAQEIIVVDSGSTDNTINIAAEFGAKTTHQSWLGYRDQKNKALELCTQPWILALDCDEEVSSELKKILHDFFNNGLCHQFAGASFPRKTWFLGRWITHGDWYPDKSLRLFRRDAGHWREPIHEYIALSGKATFLKGDLLHYSFPSIEAYLKKIHPFAEEFLKKQQAQRKAWSLWPNISRPLWRFFRAYILRRGFLDGFPGLWIAVATAFSVFVRYSRGYEEKQKKKYEG